MQTRPCHTIDLMGSLVGQKQHQIACYMATNQPTSLSELSYSQLCYLISTQCTHAQMQVLTAWPMQQCMLSDSINANFLQGTSAHEGGPMHILPTQHSSLCSISTRHFCHRTHGHNQPLLLHQHGSNILLQQQPHAHCQATYQTSSFAKTPFQLGWNHTTPAAGQPGCLALLEVEQPEGCHNQHHEGQHKASHDDSTPLDKVLLVAKHVCRAKGHAAAMVNHLLHICPVQQTAIATSGCLRHWPQVQAALCIMTARHMQAEVGYCQPSTHPSAAAALLMSGQGPP